MARKNYFDKGKKDDKSKPQTTATTRKKGDLNGDGKVDFEDTLLAIVGYIQTPRGQVMIYVAAAVFSALINLGSYTATTLIFLTLIKADWLAPFAPIIGIVIWAVLQAGETSARMDMWDWEVKQQLYKNVQGMTVKIVDKSEGQQTYLPQLQNILINTVKADRMFLIATSIFCHFIDLAMLWADYPLVDQKLMLIFQNVVIVLGLMFSFEICVGLAQKIRRIKVGYGLN